MLIQAGSLLSMEGPPRSPAVVRIAGNQIAEVESAELRVKKKGEEPVLDLSRFVLLPGFVNAHSHLELTAIGPIDGKPDFVSWIRQLVKKKTLLDPEEQKKGIREGVKKFINSGVTTIGDQISFNTEWEEITGSPLRGRLFGEVLGILPEICADIYSTFKQIKEQLSATDSLFKMHISPHSVYAVHPLVLEKILENEPPPLSCHLAESLAEEDYFKRKGGELMKFIQERGIDAPHQGISGLDVLFRLNLNLSSLMIVHGNYLNSSDQALIEKNNLSLVHCPGSHAYFGHRPFPLEKYLSCGFNVALGTDSLASNLKLDFLEELRLVKKTHPSLSASTILEMATLTGAKALKMENQIGSITPGKKADMIGFKWDGKTAPEDIVLKADQVDFVMIDGKIVRYLDGEQFVRNLNS